jgi:phosphatidylinositol-3-phosphatase
VFAIQLACGGGGSSSLPVATPKTTLTITAQPAMITPGTSSVLSWTSTNAVSVSISGMGTFGPSGTTTVTPAATTTYTASATGLTGTTSSSVTVTVSSTPPPNTVPLFGHVVLLLEENHGYSQVIGNSTMPYLNGLASQYGLATQYYANTHPSIGNYFMLTTGQIITNNDAYGKTVSADNLVRRLLTAGKTWKSYAESLPSVGYTGGDSYPYLRRHNPFSFFSDVVNSTNQKNNLVPFTQFATDLQNNQLPQFSFIVPDALNDGHDGPLALADTWLQTNIAPLIASPQFQSDGLLIIVFDEAASTDSTHGGGRVPALIISPLAKKGYQSKTLYQHPATLRLILQGLGVSSFPGKAASAPSMQEFF